MRFSLPSRILAVLSLGIGLALFAVGCGPSKGSLSGKVTYKGTSLKGGNVSFTSTGGGPSIAASIQEDGTYTVPSMVAGTYNVTVDNKFLKGASGSSSKMSMPPGGGPPGMAKGKGNIPKEGNAPPEGKLNLPGNPADYGYKSATMGDAAKLYVEIPDKYASPDQSDLTYTFTSGNQVWDIDLK